MRYQVVYLEQAEQQLVELLDYITSESRSLFTAENYVSAVKKYCDGFEILPHRGDRRDDLAVGLRVTNFRRRTIVAFFVDDAIATVVIAGIFHGGQDYESIMRV